jgi:hypothetical protein
LNGAVSLGAGNQRLVGDGLGVTVAVNVAVGVGVAVDVAVAVGVAVGVDVAVGVAVGVTVGVDVAVGVAVGGTGVSVGGSGLGVADGREVGVADESDSATSVGDGRACLIGNNTCAKAKSPPTTSSRTAAAMSAHIQTGGFFLSTGILTLFASAGTVTLGGTGTGVGT